MNRVRDAWVDGALNFSAPFVVRPVATTLITLGLALAGVLAYFQLPVAPLPQVEFPTISVQANLPGASPETMAATVAQPLERQFAQIPGVTQMTSSSFLGQTGITIQFELDRNLDGAAQDVQSAISAASGQLPRNLPSAPRYQKVNPADAPIIGYNFQSDVLPLTELDDLVENIIGQRIAQIDGVGNIGMPGQQKPAIRVQIDPIKLAATGLSLEDVRAVITTASTNSPKGYVDVDTKSYTILGNDQLTKAEEFNDVVLTFRNGAPVHISDIGRAVTGPENARSAAWQADGKRSINFAVSRQPGANVVETVARIEATMEQIKPLLPSSVKILKYQDRVQTIKASVAEVRTTLLITAVLVVFIIFIFLRNTWATIIPALAIPLSTVGAFAGMYVFGYTIDNLSLMAMTIAVGFVVDDAIVMLENIYRHIEEGMEPYDAAIKGAGEIGFTIISMSLSLIAVFIPLLLMSGIVGRLFHEFAMTVCITILISGVVSLTLTPMMCSRFLRHETGQHGAFYNAIEKGFKVLAEFYGRTLDIALNWQRTVFGVFVGTVILSGVLYVVVPKGFFPQQDTGMLGGNLEASPDISFNELSRVALAAHMIVAADPDIENLGTAIGIGRGSNGGLMSILLKPESVRKSSAEDIINRLRPKLAQLEGVRVFLQSNQDITLGGRGTKTQYQYTLTDIDTQELSDFVDQLVKRLVTMPSMRDVTTDAQGGVTTATLAIDRDKAAQYGIQPQLIDDILYDAFGQRQASQYFTQVNTYKIILEVLPEMRGTLATLDKIFVKSPLTGVQIPLSTFIKVDTKPVSSMSVNHQGQFPATTVSFNLAPGFALGDAVDAIQKIQEELGAPANLSGTFQGTAKGFQDSLATQPYLVAAAIVAVYVILGMLYESYIYPLAILSTLPSAGVGALLILIIFQYDLSVIALVGVILLIGLVKKNGIMMVDFAVTAQRERGATPMEAIREACRLRFRPIMMTSMAALLGGLPLVIAGGAGHELRRPLGLAMVGGLLVSQVLTLYTTPVVFLYLERLRARMQSKRSSVAQSISPQEHPAE